MSNDLITILISKATFWYENTKTKIEEDKKKKIDRIKSRPLASMDEFFENFFTDDSEEEYKLSESGADDFMLIKKRLELLDKNTKKELKTLTDKFNDIKKKIGVYKCVQKDVEDDDDYAESSEYEEEEEEEEEEEDEEEKE
jgi:hypothetical protein